MYNVTDIHDIQRSIIEELGYSEEKTFSELQGDRPSNKVAFHLNQLMEKDIIEKKDDRYTTTRKGRRFIIELLGKGTPNPVTLLSLIIVKDSKVYLEEQTSRLSIFRDMYRLPTDKIKNRERLKETAREIYRDKMDEEPPEIEYNGVFDKEVTLKDGVTQRYLLFYMKADYQGEKDEKFIDIDELGDLDIIPDVDRVIKKVDEGKYPFVGEWTVEEDENGFSTTSLDL